MLLFERIRLSRAPALVDHTIGYPQQDVPSRSLHLLHTDTAARICIGRWKNIQREIICLTDQMLPTLPPLNLSKRSRAPMKRQDFIHSSKSISGFRNSQYIYALKIWMNG